jgi:hypothetical protein
VDLVAVELDVAIGGGFGEPAIGGPRIRHLRAVLIP